MADNSIMFISHQHDILYFYVIKFRKDFLGATYLFWAWTRKNLGRTSSSFGEAICNRVELQKQNCSKFLPANIFERLGQE